MIELTGLIEESHVCLVSPISTDICCLICSWQRLLSREHVHVCVCVCVCQCMCTVHVAGMEGKHVCSCALSSTLANTAYHTDSTRVCVCAYVCAYLRVFRGVSECVCIRDGRQMCVCVRTCKCVCVPKFCQRHLAFLKQLSTSAKVFQLTDP